MAHRFFVTPESIRERVVVFTDAQAHQLRDVLRLRAGQEILVLDNAGHEYRVRLSDDSRAQVRGEIIEQRIARGEPQTKIILYQALCKSDKFEWVLQKGAEVGIAEFVPMLTARAIADSVRKQKYARWSQIVTEAAEQAGRGKIPPLAELQSFEASLEMAKTRGGSIYILWENEHALDLKRALDGSMSEGIHLFVGPEGGFTEREIEMARAFGAQSITLGPRIFRTETAGLVAASAILFARNEMRHA